MPENDDLDRELDRGALEELPPPIPSGFLGERAPIMTKEEDFAPAVTGGLVQESTPETRWMTVALLYLLVVTSPIAAWLLWRDHRYSLRVKVAATVAGICGYAALYAFYRPPTV